MKFKIYKNPYATRKDLFGQDFVEVEKGLTILVGANGSGKTTLLRGIADLNETKETLIYKYDNYSQGGNARRQQFEFYGMTDMFAQTLVSSEGQQIEISLGVVAQEIGAKVRELVEDIHKERLVILLDAIDSGFSINNIDVLKNNLFQVIIDDFAGRNKEVYIICAANSYELARNEDCIDVKTLQHRRFTDYEEYRDFILNKGQ